MHFTAKLGKNPPSQQPGTWYYDLDDDSVLEFGVRGLNVSLTSGRRRGSSGTPWSRSSTPLSPCRCLMLLCR